MHKGQRAGGLGGDIDARLAGADNAVVFGRLERCVWGQHQLDMLAADQRAIGHGAGIVIHHADHTIAHTQRRKLGTQMLGSAGQQPGARLRRSNTQRRRMNLYRGAGNRGALVRRTGRVAQHHADAAQRHVEFFRHDLAQCRAYAGAQVHMAVERRHTAVVPDREQDFRPFEWVGRDQRRLAGGERRGQRRLTRDQQYAGSGVQASARKRGIGAACHDEAAPALRITCAARFTALRISRWVPQRQRLPDSSRRISSSVGSGLRASSAAVITIMPLRQ